MKYSSSGIYEGKNNEEKLINYYDKINKNII
jgi:hypothetical protein